MLTVSTNRAGWKTASEQKNGLLPFGQFLSHLTLAKSGNGVNVACVPFGIIVLQTAGRPCNI
jgi:hypothetical protein